MAVAKLSEEERARALENLPGWTHDAAADAIRRTFRFRDFGEAFGFVARVALIAERMDHHPAWTNAYNRVDILLTTHEAAGLSSRDIAMARAIEAVIAPSAPR